MRIQKLVRNIIAVCLVGLSLSPLAGQAATTLTSRSADLGSSAPSATTTYTLGFKPSANENIGAIKFQLCDSPGELSTCNQPASASLSSASFSTSAPTSSVFSGFIAGSGGHAATATTFWAQHSTTAQAVTSGTSYTARLNNVVNPSTANYTYYVRVYTYSDTAGTTQNEFGTVAVSTANQIIISGTMPESLVFCVGITISTDCTTIGGGTAVNFGTFSPLTTSTGTSVMQASTNASSGYVITIRGSTMTSGANTIPAMGTQTANSTACSPSCSSTTGTSQFGTNVVHSNTPNVGTNVSGAGTATGQGGYNTADSFRFLTGDTVAGVAGPSKANTFTNSYIVNVGGDQAAGTYTATMTYICTATF